MARFIKNRKESHGATPGSLIFIGNPKMEKSEIHLMIYNRDHLEEKQVSTVAEIPVELPEEAVLWINIYGLQNTELIAKAGERFSIHPLELEDIMNTDQRPKVTENPTNLTFFLKILQYHEDTRRVSGDQVSIILGENTVITFQEKTAHYFEPVRERIRQNKGRIRYSGADYLAYALIDTLIDGYIHCVEGVGASMEEMEKEVLNNAQKSTLEEIYRMKTNVGFIRKSVFPLKEIMLLLNKTESKLIQKKTIKFLKDLNDLATQVMEAVEIYHNMANDYLNIYHSNVGNRTNEVMKVLTIFASIFIPLTFIAGVYGTNFDNLPELHFKYAYFVMLAVMAIIAATMLYYFRKKDWF
ncbi:magnesium transporter [Mariniphaga anaerophila]|uniref:Magnesium transport protein CorA n=1 Tax=Mariniphaga anaerophila TaxID=1484053 RepID=A0A1M5F748_9BACT|nr:magnesium/cobalt transporter CorA [Mariniphaga anaerophila]SHF86902.1 magnesium transporter [Mariniphaga anaerophila]